MSLEEKNLALETELMVVKDAIWGLTERVINLETEVKELKSILGKGNNQRKGRPLGQRNSNTRNSKAIDLKALKPKGKPVRQPPKRRNEEEDPLLENSVDVKIERKISSNEDSDAEVDAYLNENESPFFLCDGGNSNILQTSTDQTSGSSERKGDRMDILAKNQKSLLLKLKRCSQRKQMGTKQYDEAESSMGSGRSQAHSTIETNDEGLDSDDDLSYSPKNFKMEVHLKKGEPDPIWNHWKRVSAETEKRVIVQCIYCSSHDQLNHATKCKRHTGICKLAPTEVRNEFCHYKDYGKCVRKSKSDSEHS